MKSIRALLSVTVSLVLLVVACSQPEDLQANLEPQFGGTGDDTGSALDVSSRGVVTLGASIGESSQSQNETLFLRQFDSSPKLLREIRVGAFSYDGGPYLLPYVSEISTDLTSNIYTQLTFSGTDSIASKVQLRKYAASGSKLLWQKEWINIDSSATFDLDSNGNVFFSQNNVRAGGAYGLSYFTRYNPNGVKWYQRNSKVGPILDLEVTANGDIYIIGEKGLSRYSNNGSLLWTKAIKGTELASSGNNLFVVQNNEADGDLNVSKYTSNGAVTWSTTVANSGISYVTNLTADTKGSAYFNVSSPDAASTTVNKLNSSGASVWSRDFTIDADYGALPGDLATFDGSNIYVTGSTRGPVNGYNNGKRDGYLVRLNAQGQQVWER